MRWEYQTLRFQAHGMSGGILEPDEFDRELNRLGQEGWELVSVFETIHRGGTTRFVFASFKRPLS